MPEQFKQFDFSKTKDQKNFEKLPKKEKKEIINETQSEALAMQEKIKNGKTTDYDEAEKLFHKENKKKLVINELLLMGKDNRILDFKEHPLKFTKEEMSSLEVQQAAQQSMIIKLSNGYIKDAISIRDFFSITALLPEVIEKFPKKMQSRINAISKTEVSTVEDVNKEVKKREDATLNFLKDYDSVGHDHNNKNYGKYEDFTKYLEKYPNNNGIGFGELSILRNLGNDRHEKILRSIVDKNEKKRIIEEIRKSYRKSYNARGEGFNFSEQIVRNNPDVIFLCARKALLWGIVYKEFIKNLKAILIQKGDIETVAKIPNPDFKLADVKLRFTGDKNRKNNILHQRAVNRYIKKLEPIKQKIERGALKEPVHVEIFDESGDTGSTIGNQKFIIGEAAKKLGIDILIGSFQYVALDPHHISPIDYINDDKIARRPLAGSELLKKFKTMNEYEIENELSETAFYKIYEKISFQLLKKAGKQLVADKEYVEYFLKDIKFNL